MAMRPDLENLNARLLDRNRVYLDGHVALL